MPAPVVDTGPDGDIQKIDTPGTDNVAMASYWNKAYAVAEGIDEMRKNREFLPQFPAEDDKDYANRTKTSTMTNVYDDVLESLASKPFSKMAFLKEENVTPEMIEMQENVDGRGSHLHDFLAFVFYKGINFAIDWILVEYPKPDPDNPINNREDEIKAGRKPYWVHVNAQDVLVVQTQMNTGVEEFSYMRILERGDDGDKVRAFDRRDVNVTLWRLYSKNDKKEWALEDSGTVSINEIPMVPFVTGRRKGKSWQFKPALKNAVDLQVELYQEQTRKKNLKDDAGYGVWSASGVAPERDAKGKPVKLHVGPKTILFAPPNDDGSIGSWSRLDPSSGLFVVFSADIVELQNEIREIGKQPLTAQSGGVTRINSGMAASKSNSAVQSWVNTLESAANRAWELSAKWMNDTVSKPVVEVYKDFPIESDSNPVPDNLIAMRASKDLSQLTYWEEMGRNKVLGPNFDPEQEKTRLEDEIESGEDDDEANVLAVT